MSDFATEHVAAWLDKPSRDPKLNEARALLYFWTGRSFEDEPDSVIERFMVNYQDSTGR